MYTRSKAKRRRISQYFERAHLIQASGQVVQDPTPDEQLENEVEEVLEEVMDATDVATEGETLIEHGVIEAIEAEINVNRTTARFFRHRHNLPLQPGVLTCH
jgi:rubrerythrin